MPTKRFQEWRDQTGNIKYPFEDGVTLRANTGFALPGRMFADASIHILGAEDGIHLSKIEVTPQTTTIYVADRRERNVASVEFEPLSESELLYLTDIYGRSAGVLVAGNGQLAEFAAWDVGTHVFGLAAAPFVSSCVIPTPVAGVQGLVLDTGEILTGDAVIIGGPGVVVRKDPDQDNTIRVDFVGDPLHLRRACAESGLFKTPRFLKSISGYAGDEFGNFHIGVGDHMTDGTIMRIRPTSDGLVVEAIGSTTHG